MPLVVLLKHENAGLLQQQLPSVSDDLVFILQLHADIILPNAASAPAPCGGFAATAVYHGLFISASFEVRAPDANCGVLEFSLAAPAPGGAEPLAPRGAARRQLLRARQRATQALRARAA